MRFVGTRPSSSTRKGAPTTTVFVSCFLIIVCTFWFNGMFHPNIHVSPILANCAPRIATHPAAATIAPDFSLAFKESLGFFDDVSEKEWRLLKQKSFEMHSSNNPRTKADGTVSYVPSNFYQTYYEPDFSCRHERRIGQIGDGGKWVCDPHRLFPARDNNCLVYSVGSEGDFSFESSIRASIGSHCEIHTFDFGNYSAAVSENVTHYHQWGLSSMGHTDARGRVYKTMDQTVRDLGHEGRTIDIFKIDCEGCEWATVQSWMAAKVVLRQILVELHQVQVPGTMDFFDLLYENNYVVFHKEANIQYWQVGGGAIEYSFLKLEEGYRQL